MTECTQILREPLTRGAVGDIAEGSGTIDADMEDILLSHDVRLQGLQAQLLANFHDRALRDATLVGNFGELPVTCDTDTVLDEALAIPSGASASDDPAVTDPFPEGSNGLDILLF